MILYSPNRGSEVLAYDYKRIFVVRNGETVHIPVEELGPTEPAFIHSYGLVPVFRTREEAIECFRRTRIADLLGRIARYKAELEHYGYPWPF